MQVDRLITLETIPSSEYVLNGVVNKLYVLFKFEVQEKENAADERPPLNLSIVLDKSGSMKRGKIENAKSAIVKIIENLKFTDRISLTAYDRNVYTVFQDGDLSQKQVLVKAVRGIKAGSTTNLSGGLERGAEIMTVSPNYSNRIFIFSDGLANVGLKRIPDVENLVQAIHARGINVSSYGIGRDFNEEMMQAIAEAGMGDYFFIDRPEDIPNAVSEGIDGLLSLIARNTVLKVRGINGATVQKIYGYRATEGAKIGDLKELETRQVLVEVDIQPGSLDEKGEFLNFEVSYQHIDNIEETRKFRGTVCTKVTDDEEQIMDENEEVLVARKLLEASDRERQILKLADRGHYEEAIRRMKSMIHDLEKLLPHDREERIKHKLDLAKESMNDLMHSQETHDMRKYKKQARYSMYQSYSSKMHGMTKDERKKMMERRRRDASLDDDEF